MNVPAVKSIDTLPALIDRAARALSEARTAGEVLEARDVAQVAIDAAKSAARMARAKKAHDDVLAATYRAQGDALAIQARAKMRLADEYDAAQERGEVKRLGGDTSGVEYSNTASAADLGLRRDEIHEARQLRDAELQSPGVIESVIFEQVERGEEPTKAAIRQAAEAVTRPFVANNSGKTEWYTPERVLEAARAVLGGFDLDPASSEDANRNVRAERIFTAEDDGLAQDWPIGRIWMNPPYAAGLVDRFVSRFCDEIRRGSTGIVLVNNATETGWFHDLLAVATAVCFPKGRIRFICPDEGDKGTPLQGQAIIYCGSEPEKFKAEFGDRGTVLCPLP